MFSENFYNYLKFIAHWDENDLLLLREGRAKFNNKHCGILLRSFAMKGRSDLIQEIFTYMDSNGIAKAACINEFNLKDETALSLAAIHNQPKAFVLLVKAGGNIHQTNKKLHTALALAYQKGHKEVLESFCSNFKTVPYYDEHGRSIIESALDKDLLEFAKFLLSHTVQVNQCYALSSESNYYGLFEHLVPLTPLVRAIKGGKVARAIQLLECNVDPNLPAQTGETPLGMWYHLLETQIKDVKKDQETLVLLKTLLQKLLEKGADPLQSTDIQRGVLFSLIINRAVCLDEHPGAPKRAVLDDVLEMLIKHCKDINKVDKKEGVTILNWASLCGDQQSAMLLLKNGANPLAISPTPYHFEQEIADCRNREFVCISSEPKERAELKLMRDRLNHCQPELLNGYNFGYYYHATHSLIPMYQQLTEKFATNHSILLSTIVSTALYENNIPPEIDTVLPLPTPLKVLVFQYAFHGNGCQPKGRLQFGNLGGNYEYDYTPPSLPDLI